MKRICKLITLLFALLALTFLMVACNDNANNNPSVTPSVAPSDDGIPVITAEDNYLLIAAEAGATGNLLSYMQAKEDAGEFAFTEMGGMITEINGVANAADWSWCWMLYTTDSEFSVATYGQVKLNGTIYTSSAIGAESLPVTAGEKYLWVYTAF